MENIETSGSALATGSIAARFISQTAVDEANDRREQEWKDAYARIGQEPPPQMKEQPDDGRTLYERLKEQEILKQEEWDNRMKLSNQYRGLDNEELNFLADKIKERRTKEQKEKAEDNVEVQAYREALAKKNAASLAAAEPQTSVPPASSSSSAKPSTSAVKPRIPPKAPKKDIKSLMKGVVVKKAKPAAAQAAVGKGIKRAADGDVQGEKKRKM
ncbi:uncharacterized protein EHS24_001841 [Apiotrichum porosum]|uniref:FAM192A/Fyv6 N-terminal domain-containing protein n=1 Tax=Apiotrichum porosum TaxID=105984 RepID=A0A427XJC4_9TREE|nr:uncharacterized protein EHS24_001841 [Apiotrichum porosum]RSH78918.1 hypothetical protein EHS24_001841 [Apiotrichum porosum]